MTSIDTYNNLIALFEALDGLRNLADLNSFILQIGLDKEITQFHEKYPPLKFTIKKANIACLKKEGILDDRNRLDTDNFVGTPLERLLVAALWKNGDINKIQHIVDGILQADGFRTNHSLIFKQFGQSLTNILEPIVDQHVLRAFEIKSLKIYSEDAVNSLRKKSIYKISDKVHLDAYREWFKKILEQISPGEQAEFKNRLDKVLFIKGKIAKI